jgi:hypothetical protein
MKAKNEKLFTYMRIRRNDLQRFKKLNLFDNQNSDKHIPMHETVGLIIDKIELKQQTK